jgi:aspartate aminotransferase
MQISSQGRAVAASETLALGARIQELRQSGVEVISFATGEPDFDTPEFVKDAARAALAAGYTKYTAASGAPELRNAIARKMSAENGRPTESAEVVVTAGAKQALALAFQAVLDPGDEVLIPAPYWVSFPQQVLLCRGVPVIVPTHAAEGFVATRQSLERHAGRRTRALVLNSPSNPTGTVYDREHLEEILELARELDLWVISDETYEFLVYGSARHISPSSLSEDARSRTLVACSFSKSYSMTGWRVGYLVGPREVAAAAGRIASHTTSNVNSIAQKAALAALQGPRDGLETARGAFKERRNTMLRLLQALPGVSVPEPQGAFYAFPSFESRLGGAWNGKKIEGSAALAELLLEEAGVAVVPGSAFGTEGHLRFSYTVGVETIRRGMERVAQVLESLA